MIDFQGRAVLVTGIAGFVGANLAAALVARGARVHGLLRPSTNLWRLGEIEPSLALHDVELTDAPALRAVLCKTRPSVIYHLATQRAARTPERRAATACANLLGTLNLLEATLAAGCDGFVHAGSSMEYGAKDHPTQETDTLAPVSFFAATKAASTLLCEQFAREHRLPLVILRLYSVYGYWEGPHRLIPTAMLAALGSGSIALTEAGYRRDLIFVPDVVEACLLAAGAATEPGEILNVGSGQQWSNEQVVDLIDSISGRRLHRRTEVYPPRETDTSFWVADNAKARRVMGWQPRHSLHEGLAKTWTFMKQHRDRYAAIAQALAGAA
jgi:nucleoside-diphosphate-sugar epimerase